MCGIVGYIGPKKAKEVLLEGLSKLEYRGYDSAGISLLKDGEITSIKAVGRLTNLIKEAEDSNVESGLGIGHTRWATHGEPSFLNSHPHNSSNGRISLVHNGIIENYMEIKKELIEKGYTFVSETDTEVVPNLIDSYYQGDLLDALIKASLRLRGSFALAVISSEDPDRIVCVRKDSPLILGIGEKGEAFVASDVPAVLKYTNKVIYLNDMEFVDLTSEGIKIFDRGKNILEKTTTEITWSAQAAEKAGYDHFTIKEINEQVKAIKDTMTSRLVPGQNIKLEELGIGKSDLENASRLYIIACGGAYNAGLIAKAAIEKLSKIQVEIEVSSEFRYQDPYIDEKSIVIIISQSGETADSLAVLRQAKEKNAKVIAITNVVGSSIAREADSVFYTWAGPEIGVASTKAYLAQVLSGIILAIYFAEELGSFEKSELEKIKEELTRIPEKIQTILDKQEDYKELAEMIYKDRDVYFLGRGLDYATSVEGALKLKELTYIHADAYKGGELKHGPIALVEKDTKVIVALTQKDLAEKMLSNVKEVSSRGAKTYAIASQGIEGAEDYFDKIYYVPKSLDILMPLLSIIPLQLLAYYVCCLKGLDIDKPRNLAKSVTVE